MPCLATVLSQINRCDDLFPFLLSLCQSTCFQSPWFLRQKGCLSTVSCRIHIGSVTLPWYQVCSLSYTPLVCVFWTPHVQDLWIYRSFLGFVQLRQWFHKTFLCGCYDFDLLSSRFNVKGTTIRTRASFDPCLLCVPPISKMWVWSIFGVCCSNIVECPWFILLPFDAFKKRVNTYLYLKYFVNWFLLFLWYFCYYNVYLPWLLCISL